jgi:hypothetical protein
MKVYENNALLMFVVYGIQGITVTWVDRDNNRKLIQPEFVEENDINSFLQEYINNGYQLIS